MKQVILLNTKREGYSVDQCGHTMTVGDLLEYLQDFDEETPIYFSNDNGYTYGSIKHYDIQTEYEEEDE